MKKFSLLLIAAAVFSLAVNAQEEETFISKLQPEIQYTRPGDKSGLNHFETTKDEQVPYEGLKVKLGAGFTQLFQSLTHSNSGAVPLYPRLGPGFSVAQANLNIDVQLADGIKLNLETYLSSRHHSETWVKGGYIQFDKLPFKGEVWDNLMEYVTVKMGHMEINYGDQHFRRSDGGNTIHNPFAENYIMDAFATEVAGEVYLKYNGFMGMVGLSNGLINGGHQIPENSYRNPSLYLKGAYDKELQEKVRVRGSASWYWNTSGGRSTLYAGDRTGSNYFFVMDGVTSGNPPAATTAANAYTSGRVNPGFTNQIRALQLNGFAKIYGLELFGTFENAKGSTNAEKASGHSFGRSVNQLAADVIYRIGEKEKVYVGARYNTLKGEMIANNYDDKQSVNRVAVGGGWFLTPNVLLKGEYVDQKYKDWPATNRWADGHFKGVVVAAVVGF